MGWLWPYAPTGVMRHDADDLKIVVKLHVKDIKRQPPSV